MSTPGGAEALDQARAALTRYVVFPSPEAADSVTLYAAATHATPALEFAPRLVIKSPLKRCGKSRLLDVLTQLVRNPMPTADISAAALVRSITAHDPPTILLDEADAIFGKGIKGDEKAEHLRGILNAGFGRDRPYKRWDAIARAVEDCPTFAMAVIAGIGAMPDTIEDRAVIISLRRKAPNEHAAKYRIRRDKPNVAAAGERLAGWVAPIAAAIGAAEPDMPDGLHDRAEDVWEALIAVAAFAGASWPARAARAAQALAAGAEAADTQGSYTLRLLADIREVFTATPAPFLPSRELVARLAGFDDAPWREFALTGRSLADRLRAYGITPGRDSTGAIRGYRAEDFADTFARYLPGQARPGGPSETVKPSETPADQPERSDAFPASDTLKCQTKPNRQALTSQPDGLTVSDTPLPPAWPPGTIGAAVNGHRPGTPP